MIQLAIVFYFIFGVLVQAGGIIGFIKAKSRASLIAGLVSGGLLDVAAVLIISGREQLGLVLGTIVTVLLLGRFGPAFFKTKKFMPAGMIFVLGAISLAISVAALIQL